MSDIVTNADICGAIVEDCEADAKSLKEVADANGGFDSGYGPAYAKRLYELYGRIQQLAKVVERLSKHAPIDSEEPR